MAPAALQYLTAADGAWTLASRRPGPALGAYVRALEGYEERLATSVRRRALPHGGVVLVINFGASWRVADPRAEADAARFASFTAGIDDFASLIDCAGRAFCLQVDFTPIGARRFFGLPMHEMARRVVTLDQVLGREAERLADRLFQAPDWAQRFDIAEAAIARRIAAAAPADAGILHAWQRIQRRGGALAIGALARELDCSRKHLVARFRDQIGLPPKSVAAIARFNRALALLEGRARPDLADIAVQAGYFDQPHFNRDFLALAGITPGAFLRARRQDGDGIGG